MKPLWQPWRAVDVEIPPDGVRAVGGQGVKGVHRVAFGFAHLLPVLVLDMSHDDDVLVGRLVKEQGGDGQKGVEPPSGLVHSLRDKVCRELLLKQILVFKGVVVLGKWHGAGVKPAVDNLWHPLHLFPTLWTGYSHIVNERTVQLNLIRAVH